jgi:hypothetical protein
MMGLLLLSLAGLVGVSWWSLLKGKEQARHAASKTCKEHGLSLMDDTVMLDSVQLKKQGELKGWCLRYRFEFARQGVLHKGGNVLIAPGRLPTVIIKTNSGQLIQEV